MSSDNEVLKWLTSKYGCSTKHALAITSRQEPLIINGPKETGCRCPWCTVKEDDYDL